MRNPFELFLFYVNLPYVQQAEAAGLNGIIVDWEHQGKEDRQQFFDTQINRHTPQDLHDVRRATDLPVLCRVNNSPEILFDEIEQAIDGGADEILLPMVKTVAEVKAALNHVNDRCRLGILVETREATAIAADLAALPLSRVYVGLNDLAISRGTASIFTPLIDGLLEEVRSCFRQPFGFAGATLPDRGSPIPCRLLINEMARLKTNFTFLRRSFYRDLRHQPFAESVRSIQNGVQQTFQNQSTTLQHHHKTLETCVKSRLKTDMATATVLHQQSGTGTARHPDNIALKKTGRPYS